MKLPPKHEQKSEYDDNKNANDANKNDQNSDHFISYNREILDYYYLIDNLDKSSFYLLFVGPQFWHLKHY